MTAVMIGEENRRVFREANKALADRVWAKLRRAGAVRDPAPIAVPVQPLEPNDAQ